MPAVLRPPRNLPTKWRTTDGRVRDAVDFFLQDSLPEGSFLRYCRAMGAIYNIKNLRTAAVYVGSAKCPEKRWAGHKKELRGRRHHCRHLQNAWVKYGEDAFVFTVVEDDVPVENLVTREQCHLDDRLLNFDRNLTYNICPTAGSCLGRKFSDESKTRMSVAQKGRKKPSREVAVRTATWIKKYGKDHTLVSPDGSVHKFRNVREFARNNSLEHNSLRLLLCGKIRQHRLWRRLDSPVENLLSPEGVLFEDITNLKQFCASRSLNYKSIHAVARGSRKTCAGWTCPSPQKTFKIKH